MSEIENTTTKKEPKNIYTGFFVRCPYLPFPSFIHALGILEDHADRSLPFMAARTGSRSHQSALWKKKP